MAGGARAGRLLALALSASRDDPCTLIVLKDETSGGRSRCETSRGRRGGPSGGCPCPRARARLAAGVHAGFNQFSLVCAASRGVRCTTREGHRFLKPARCAMDARAREAGPPLAFAIGARSSPWSPTRHSPCRVAAYSSRSDQDALRARNASPRRGVWHWAHALYRVTEGEGGRCIARVALLASECAESCREVMPVRESQPSERGTGRAIEVEPTRSHARTQGEPPTRLDEPRPVPPPPPPIPPALPIKEAQWDAHYSRICPQAPHEHPHPPLKSHSASRLAASELVFPSGAPHHSAILGVDAS